MLFHASHLLLSPSEFDYKPSFLLLFKFLIVVQVSYCCSSFLLLFKFLIVVQVCYCSSFVLLSWAVIVIVN